MTKSKFVFLSFAPQAGNISPRPSLSTEGFETYSLASFLEVRGSARSASKVRDKTTTNLHLIWTPDDTNTDRATQVHPSWSSKRSGQGPTHAAKDQSGAHTRPRVPSNTSRRVR